MAIKVKTNISKQSYSHGLRIPGDLYEWLEKQRSNPSESFSAIILKILWEKKAKK